MCHCGHFLDFFTWAHRYSSFVIIYEETAANKICSREARPLSALNHAIPVSEKKKKEWQGIFTVFPEIWMALPSVQLDECLMTKSLLNGINVSIQFSLMLYFAKNASRLAVMKFNSFSHLIFKEFFFLFSI